MFSFSHEQKQKEKQKEITFQPERMMDKARTDYNNS
jgi:hypothetical protein